MKTPFIYDKGKGDTEVSLALIDSGLYYNFITQTWVATPVADCLIFMIEQPSDSDDLEAVYIAEFIVPVGGPYTQIIVLASTFELIGGPDLTSSYSQVTVDEAAIADAIIASLITEGYIPIWGSDSVVITVLDSNDVPIPGVQVTVKNAAQTVLQTKVITDIDGKTFDVDGNSTISLDPILAGYKVLCNKAGYTFSVTTLSQADVAAGVKTIVGTSWLVGIPSIDPNSIIVFEDLLKQDGITPIAEADVSAIASIISLPYDYDEHLHIGVNVDATLHKVGGVFTGRVYWVIVRGATVKFSIDNFFKTGKSIKKTLPTDLGITEIRLIDIV